MHFFGALFEICTHDRWFNMFDGNDEIGRHDLSGIDQKQRTMSLMFIFYPERNDLAIAMKFVVDANALVGEFEMRDIRRRVGKECECECAHEYHECKEGIVEENAHYRERYRDDAERPEPIGPTLDVLVLVCGPSQRDIVVGHKRLHILYHSRSVSMRKFEGRGTTVVQK